MQINKGFTNPEDIFKDPGSEDMESDVARLIGYCISLGWTNKDFPAEHCIELTKHFTRRMMSYPTHPDSEKKK